MKILLQDKGTLEFVDGDGLRTASRDCARNFDNGNEALLFCISHHLHNIQILYEFGNARLNFTVPINDTQPEPVDAETVNRPWPDSFLPISKVPNGKKHPSLV